ncbi:Sua5/YciO/YrdC/YwlC family protein [Aliiglaciecola sp. LCG003]|uniref:Sua5/YciO/YrdC/YwlC family protein n=1 Tax=Aliiglaciecola sp. LCG003 TaxID=3053655 RepID=UPI0025729D52|nr:Sua5/YciO/YrdC/YwlC family protein [Aliiglaciecola sp. LCG003]WJG09481.1 Sua5/YciO/YrdC/YwlC family protein [Aliiglaciecola sp. LCG003]
MLIKPNSAQLITHFSSGAILAYPTEAVFGLGCDPRNEEAISRLFELKNRPLHKGVILIAGNVEQLEDFVDFSAIPKSQLSEVMASWPGPHTWLLPKQQNTSDSLTGGSDLIAVRVSAYPPVIDLCKILNSALISTSANESGLPPATSQQQIVQQFGDQVVCIEGKVGQQRNPSQIRNGLTGEIIRAG